MILQLHICCVTPTGLECPSLLPHLLDVKNTHRQNGIWCEGHAYLMVEYSLMGYTL